MISEVLDVYCHIITEKLLFEHDPQAVDADLDKQISIPSLWMNEYWIGIHEWFRQISIHPPTSCGCWFRKIQLNEVLFFSQLNLPKVSSTFSTVIGAG